MKRCSKCLVERPETDFYCNGTKGRRSQCCDCEKARSRRNWERDGQADWWKERASRNLQSWINRNYEKALGYGKRRRALIAGDETAENLTRSEVYKRSNGVCYLCNQGINLDEIWHIDHVVPLSRGGRHVYENVAATHAGCNTKKKARLPEELECQQ